MFFSWPVRICSPCVSHSCLHPCVSPVLYVPSPKVLCTLLVFVILKILNLGIQLSLLKLTFVLSLVCLSCVLLLLSQINKHAKSTHETLHAFEMYIFYGLWQCSWQNGSPDPLKRSPLDFFALNVRNSGHISVASRPKKKSTILNLVLIFGDLHMLPFNKLLLQL